MLACVDVHYPADGAVAACLVFADWTDGQAAASHVERLATVEPYEPGRFYRRELPCLLAVLAKVTAQLAAVVIDGYVWLGGEDRPGLGAHLYEALGKKTAVVGVAKTPFQGTTAALQVVRRSSRPLWVTAAGMDTREAAQCVETMDGPFRIPTLLRQVDRLCRETT